MSTELAIYGASVPDRMRYAEALSGASLLPDAYRGKPANVLLALEYGNALGIPPMVAIQQVHIIQGRPVASAQLIGALVRKAGHRLRVTGDDKRAMCEIVRGDDPEFTFRAEWTWDRAVAAKLTGKDTWKAYPGNMLRARAITECARDACPEALAGISYTAEELGDDTLPAEAYPQTDDGAVSEPHRQDDASSAPSSPDIADAEIVDDATGEVLNPDAGVAEGEAAAPASVHPATSSAFRGLQAQLSERAKADGWSRADVIGWVGLQVGRPIASTKDLTPSEVDDVRAILRGARREVAA
jgi:hypothetical protein